MSRNLLLDRRAPQTCEVCRGKFYLSQVGRPRRVCRNPDCTLALRARQTQRRRKRAKAAR